MSPSVMVSRRTAPAVLVLVAALAAGCGSSGSSPSSTSASTPPSSAPASSAAAGPADPAAAKAQITAHWQKFFDSKAPQKAKLRYLEDASSLTGALQAAAKAAKTSGAQSAKVTSVTFTSPTQANVKYDLSVNGTVALHGADGVAVLQGGVWKVSKQTFCTLVGLTGATNLPGCTG